MVGGGCHTAVMHVLVVFRVFRSTSLGDETVPAFHGVGFSGISPRIARTGYPAGTAAAPSKRHIDPAYPSCQAS
jgi:hypothetical protein